MAMEQDPEVKGREPAEVLEEAAGEWEEEGAREEETAPARG